MKTEVSEQCCSPTGSGCHPWPCAEAYGIPRGNTVRRGSECGVEPPNYPNLAECTEPLSKGMSVSKIRPFSDPMVGNLTFLPDVYDARGVWSTADGRFEESLEQCGDRFMQRQEVIHDFIHGDGTPEGGVRDYYGGPIPQCKPLYVRGAWATSEVLHGDPCFVMIELNPETLEDNRLGAVRCLQTDGTLKFYNGFLHPSYEEAQVHHRQPDSCTNCDLVPAQSLAP